MDSYAPRSSALIKPSSRWSRAKTWGNWGEKCKDGEIVMRFNNLFQARRSASRQRRRGAIGSRWAREKNRDGTATGRTTRGPRVARGSPAGQVRGKTCWINVTPPPLASRLPYISNLRGAHLISNLSDTIVINFDAQLKRVINGLKTAIDAYYPNGLWYVTLPLSCWCSLCNYRVRRSRCSAMYDISADQRVRCP